MISYIQIKHRFRLLKQVFKSNPVAIIGGYHGGNLGDIALGLSVKGQLWKQHKRNSILQTIYSINRLPWRKCSNAILGGGAIGYEDSLSQVYIKYSDNLKNLAVIGVDFNEKNYSDNTINILKNATWLSCRNEQQKIKLEQLSGRDDVVQHPDLAFSLHCEFCKSSRNKSTKEKILLINVIPLYSSIKNGVITPAMQYKEERPELYSNYETLIESYITGVRTLVQKHIAKGYTVESIPFTPQDDEMARYIFKENEINFNKYTDSPIKMLKKIAESEVVFATRYHATIFALKCGANLIPMAYAKKNEELLSELGIERHKYLNANELSLGNHNFPDSIKVENSLVSKWEQNTIAVLNDCFKKLLGN